MRRKAPASPHRYQKKFSRIELVYGTQSAFLFADMVVTGIPVQKELPDTRRCCLVSGNSNEKGQAAVLQNPFFFPEFFSTRMKRGDDSGGAGFNGHDFKRFFLGYHMGQSLVSIDEGQHFIDGIGR